MGYGLIAVSGKKARLLHMDVLKLSPRKDTYERLGLIHETVRGLILRHRPYAFAIEAPFFGKNVQSMLKLGRAQGAAIVAAMEAGLPVTEYAPKTIKQVITGKGNADKEQVWKMLQYILDFQAEPGFLDATDGLAVALCHFYQLQGLPGKASKDKGWDAFVRDNPQRVRG